jgi:putative membrane protein
LTVKLLNLRYMIIRWLTITLAFFVASLLVPGFEIQNIYFALVAALLLGLLNLTIKPILVLLTLPITILTFGIFVWVINGLLLWFLSSILAGFSVSGFGAAFLGGLVISFFRMLLEHSEKKHA